MSNRKANYRVVERFREFEAKILQLRADWELRDAAAEFNVVPRTIRNWVAALASNYTDDRGKPVITILQAGKRSVIRVKANGLAIVPHIFDFAALAMARRILGIAESTALVDGMVKLQKGIEDSPDAKGDFKLPHHDGQVRALERKFALFQTGPSVCPAHIFDPLFAALVLNHQLEIVYGPPSRTKIVEPLCLAVYRDVLYLIVRTAGKTRPYTLLVDRMVSTRDLGVRKTFSYPKDWNPEAYRARKFGILEGDPFHVVLRFEEHLYGYLAKRRWNFPCSLERLPDQRIRMTMDVESSPELTGWICGFGEDVLVEGPPELRDDVAGRLRRGAAQYQQQKRGLASGFPRVHK